MPAEVTRTYGAIKQIHWPTSIKEWIGLGVIGLAAGLLLWKDQTELALLAVGLLLNQLGVSAQNATILTAAVAAATRAGHAAIQADQAASQAASTRDVILDAHNPIEPGMPGWHETRPPHETL